MQQHGVFFLPGKLTIEPSPLRRFLPAIPTDIYSSWISSNLPSGEGTGPGFWILDPFGSDPRLAVEIARAGYRVLVAANNPVLRFMIEMNAQPPSESDLRSSLADLAASFKGSERLEPHIRSLYSSECVGCGEKVEVDAYLWDRGENQPFGKLFTCQACGASGEFPISENDLSVLSQIGPAGLHRARALERVASLDDPDRQHAEDALDTYLPRAIYILFTLLNKIEGLPSPKRNLDALLLSAFDLATSLWPYPGQRARPRLLTIPTHFRENNIWKALEESIPLWASQQEAAHVPVSFWPELPPESGGICIFEGRIRDLFHGPVDQDFESPSLKELAISAVMTVLPRPNQAFWTLSTLWTGWLWGRQAAFNLKSALRRRRYDWNWHCTALHSALETLSPVLNQNVPFGAFIGELETGFLTTALLAGELAGYALDGIAIRTESELGQILWKRKPSYSSASQEHSNRQELLDVSIQAGISYLDQRNEPSNFHTLLAAILGDLLEKDQIQMLQNETPAEVYSRITNLVQQVFTTKDKFIRFGESEHSLEIGLWWKPDQPSKVSKALDKEQPVEIPLMDRVEIEVVNYLIANPGQGFYNIDFSICQSFPSLLTPERSLIAACMESYAVEIPAGSNNWNLRTEDRPQNRRYDLQDIKNRLASIGKRIGFEVSGSLDKGNPLIHWKTPGGGSDFVFYIQASALISRFVLPGNWGTQNVFLVLPGGRSGLLDYKIQHDPRWNQAFEDGLTLVKFRHIRRLSESKSLEAEQVLSALKYDPIIKSEVQMTLI